LLDGLHDEIQRGLRILDVRRKSALVAHIGVMTGVLQALLECVEDFGTPAHGLSQAGSADGHDYEFLEVDRIVGVSATIEDVHHRHRKHMGAGTPHITVERKVCRFCCRLGDRQGYAKDGIGTESALVWRADRKSTRLNSSHVIISYAVFCLKKKKLEHI